MSGPSGSGRLNLVALLARPARSGFATKLRGEDWRLSMSGDNPKAAHASARHLLRSVPIGALATIMADSEGAPYASMVSLAKDHAGAPVLLLSNLADHTKNLRRDQRVSLLLIGDRRKEDPMAGERLTLQGRLSRSDDPHLRQRYIAYHPAAALYADFTDFNIYHMAIERAHLVAGFGRIHWIAGDALLIPPSPALIAGEADIVAHMNDDHADAVNLYATCLLHRAAGDWRMTGVDPEGADLRFGDQVARLAFEHRVEDSTGVRKELIRLVNIAKTC